MLRPVKARGRKRGSMEALSSLVPKIYPGREPDEAHAMRVFAAWSKLVSDRILQNARPVMFRAGVLHVNTASSTWANALSLESDSLLARMRGRVPGCRVRSLRFRVGPLPPLGPEVFAPPPRARLRPVTDLPEDVARELARIADDELRDVVARAAAVSLGDRSERRR